MSTENAEADRRLFVLSPNAHADVAAHPCEYGHAWAWAALVRGGARQLCYRCGAAR